MTTPIDRESVERLAQEFHDCDELPETLLTLRAALDVAEADKQLAVAAALREAADTASTWWDDPQMREAILALIPDGGSALDRALAAELERCAKVADSYNEDPYPQTEYDRGWARSAQVIAAAIRAQGDKA